MNIWPKLVVYYFSGTGNSENVTKWLAETAREKGMEVSVVNIGKTSRLNIQPPDKNALVAFISPIHGFNYPPVMVNFLLRFPKGKNNVLLLNTRAGMLIGKWITPGLTGVAFYFAALILKLKGYSINSMFPVDLPSNWISVHPGLNDRTVKYLHERNYLKVKKFAERVLAGKNDFRGVREIIQDTLIAPVSLGYYFMGRFFLSKTYYASSDCDNCDLCIRSCPVKAIKMVDNRPFWTFKCESCMHCMSFCPKKAIETAHGSVLIFSVVLSVVASVVINKYLPEYNHFLDETFAGSILNSAIFVALFFIWYRMIHFSLRFRFIERFIVYTSLTKYKFWGRRYKALKTNKI